MAVPDTTTFSLQDVVNEINPTTDDLVDCFADANPALFDPVYEGSKNQLLNFRNYGGTDFIYATPDWMVFININPPGQNSNIQCNTTWTVYYVSQTWIHYSTLSNTIFVDCDNNTGADRAGEIRIRNDNDSAVIEVLNIYQPTAM